MDITKTTADKSNTSPFTALVTMVYDPMRAFVMLEHRRAVWLPLLLVMLSSGVMLMWYYSAVDFEWLRDKMVSSMADVSAEQREQAGKVMSKNVLQTTSLVGAMVGIPIMAAVTGLYFLIAAKIKKLSFTFGQGFALAAWGSIPVILTSLIGIMQIMLSSTGQLDFSQLNPLSINQLFFQYEMGSTWAGLLDTLNIGTVLNIILLVCGFQVWAKVPRPAAITVVLIPYVVIFGIWIAINLSKAA